MIDIDIVYPSLSFSSDLILWAPTHACASVEKNHGATPRQQSVQEPEREPAEKDHGASPRKQGRPRARARASEKCYQLAGRPSEEVRAAEEVVETTARCVSLLEPLASEGASMRARSRRSAPTS